MPGRRKVTGKFRLDITCINPAESGATTVEDAVMASEEQAPVRRKTEIQINI